MSEKCVYYSHSEQNCRSNRWGNTERYKCVENKDCYYKQLQTITAKAELYENYLKAIAEQDVPEMLDYTFTFQNLAKQALSEGKTL